MKKKILICFSLLSILTVFFVKPKVTKAELVDTYTYTNFITTKGYSYPNTKLITAWSDYIDHVGYSSTCDIMVGYTLNFAPSEITFKIDSIYINNVNFSSYTRYYNVWDNNTKIFTNYQLNINGQPPVSLTRVNSSDRFNRDMHYLYYIDSSPYRYYFGFSLFANLEYMTPLFYKQYAFSDQYRSNNRFMIDMGENDTNDFYFMWIVPKPLGLGYDVPPITVDLKISQLYDIGFKDGKNEILNNYSNYGFYDSTQYFNYGSLQYQSGKRAGQSIAESGDFKSLITAVFDVPIQTFNNLFDFNLLGFNMKPLVATLLTLSIILGVIRFIASAFRSS
ncbi:MAG: hypothetical protein MJ191_05705 [Clostridium sp.]|nr:hypothetical protein [Clostridium sp.]